MPFENVLFVGHGDYFGIGEGIFVKGFQLSLEALGGEWRCHFFKVCV